MFKQIVLKRRKIFWHWILMLMLQIWPEKIAKLIKVGTINFGSKSFQLFSTNRSRNCFSYTILVQKVEPSKINYYKGDCSHILIHNAIV
jgi:hypothetical protein